MVCIRTVWVQDGHGRIPYHIFNTCIQTKWTPTISFLSWYEVVVLDMKPCLNDSFRRTLQNIRVWIGKHVILLPTSNLARTCSCTETMSAWPKLGRISRHVRVFKHMFIGLTKQFKLFTLREFRRPFFCNQRVGGTVGWGYIVMRMGCGGQLG